jgi:hypothetical protein
MSDGPNIVRELFRKLDDWKASVPPQPMPSHWQEIFYRLEDMQFCARTRNGGVKVITSETYQGVANWLNLQKDA